MPEEAFAKSFLIITMASGGTESANRDEHARAGNVAMIDGVAESDIDVVRRAYIAYGSETGQQGDARINTGAESALGNSFLEVFECGAIIIVGIGEAQMGMGVDEAGQQSGVAQIDDLSTGGDRSAGANGNDAAGGNHNQAGSDQGIIFAIEEGGGLQNKRFVGWLWPLPVNPRPEKCSKQK